jgi:hypothetical protein
MHNAQARNQRHHLIGSLSAIFGTYKRINGNKKRVNDNITFLIHKDAYYKNYYFPENLCIGIEKVC